MTTDDLGVVHGKGKNAEFEQMNPAIDINALYQDALDRIRVKRARVDQQETAPKQALTEQQQKDVYVRSHSQHHGDMLIRCCRPISEQMSVTGR